MLTGRFLFEVRRKAIRRGVWFKALDQVERGILSLAARIVDRVESVVLGVELVKILWKIRNALKGTFVRRMEKYGLSRVKKLVSQALAWGNNAAIGWNFNKNFTRYVTLISMNDLSGYFA